MKSTTARRCLSLLLTLALVFSLAAPARADETTEGGGTGTEDTTLKDITLTGPVGDNRLEEGVLDDTYTLKLEAPVTNGERDGIQLNAVLEPQSNATQGLHVSWSSDKQDIVQVEELENGRKATIIPQAPGDGATITVSAGDDTKRVTKTISVTVSGIQLSDSLAKDGITVAENAFETIKLGKDFFLYGDAEGGTIEVSVMNNKNSVIPRVEADNSITVEGISADEATVVITVTVPGKSYKEEFPVKVTASRATIEHTTGVSASEPLKFSELEAKIKAKCKEITGGELASITGVTVPTAQGTLYLGYKSEADTGAGVAGSQPYYADGAVRGPYIKDITFVPNITFAGEKATIHYTGMNQSGRSFKGEIIVTLKETETDVSITSDQGKPVDLSAALFSKVCQSELGSPLSYVIFTLPPVSQGELYQDYKGEGDYGMKVSSTQKYDQSEINDLTFVPAPGFSGTVRIGYAGYSVSGGKYTGELVITVTQGLDAGIELYDDGRGYITFSTGSFESFCSAATGARMGYVSFTPPSTTQGNLYSYWRGGDNRGTLVTAEDRYYPTGAPRVEQVTFVAAEGFHGTVRVPFRGVNINGKEFSGTAELNFQSSGAGDVRYSCAPGGYVKLVTTDFNSLSMELTGQRLHYVVFNALPDLNQGTLYHNRTSAGSIGARVTTATKYFNSATPYLTNLSFWAKEDFRGSVEVPFTGCAVSGETFSGVMVIDSTSGGGSGSSGGSRVSYVTSGRQTVAFDSGDFDAACQAAAGSSLNYLRFTLPSSSQGILYLGYREGEPTRAVSGSDNLYRGGEMSVSNVTFMPAVGFSGVASIPFTAWTIGGSQVSGAVEVTVKAGTGTLTTVQYATYGTPVALRAYDFQAAAAGNQPVSLRFTGLPDESQGKLYYQYVSPVQYSWQADVTTDYSLSGDPSVSNLTFLPKAGYTGVVNIPYTATNADGSTYSGNLRITMERPGASAYFRDLAGAAPQTISAADFLHDLGVVNGMSPSQYGPSLSIRRGDFCLMICRAFQFNAGSGTGRFFTDVPAGAYYADAVNTLSALGIVNGTGNNRFMPSASISRQDAALMIQRTLAAADMDQGSGSAKDLNAYADGSQVNSYAQGAVAGLLQLGLLPVSGNQLSPRADLTRADMAVLLHRAMTQ